MTLTLDHGTVLIADERPMARETAARKLRRMGYAVREAASARQALEVLATGPVDLVITSTSLPDLPGLGLLQHLCGRLAHAAPPVAILDEPDHRWTADALMAGACDAWTRGVGTAELHARVARRLGDVRVDRQTGLTGARAIKPELDAALGRARGRGRAAGVVAVELTGLRGVTETLGFEAAERALVTLSHRILAALPTGASLARVGGDTLVAVLSDQGSAASVQAAVTAVMRQGLAPVRLGADEAWLTPVVGHAAFPRDGEDADALMHEAARSLARARRLGNADALRRVPLSLGA